MIKYKENHQDADSFKTYDEDEEDEF